MMLLVTYTVSNGEGGKVAYRAEAAPLGLDMGSPTGYGWSEEEALGDLEQEIERRREWIASWQPLPEGYPKTVAVQI